MPETQRLILRLFREGVSFVDDADGKLLYENTYQ